MKIFSACLSAYWLVSLIALFLGYRPDAFTIGSSFLFTAALFLIIAVDGKK